jgi:hypothetical protein
MTGSKGLTHVTSETVYECCEIAGSGPSIYHVLEKIVEIIFFMSNAYAMKGICEIRSF